MRPLTAVRAGSGAVLFAGRAWEQGLFGVATLVLAARLDLETFAVASLLLVLNAVAVTVGDWGLGLAVLRLGPGVQAARGSLSAVRRTNLWLGAITVAVGVALGGEAGGVLVATAAIWMLAAESQVRKASALRLHRPNEIVVAEVVGSAVFMAVVLVGAHPAGAVTAVGVALVAKHSIEIALVRSWRGSFVAGGARAEVGTVWFTQVLSYVTANLDYLVVGTMIGPAAFAVYVLGFRAANAIPAQLASVATRLSLVELARAPSVADRQRTYDKALRRLFGAGGAGALVTSALAPLLPVLLGARWRDAVGVTVVLSLAIPWRLTLGLAGAVALAGDAAGRFLRWELARLAVTAVALACSALTGLPGFVVAVACVHVVVTAAEHTLACRATGLQAPRALRPVAAGTVVLIALAGLVLL